MNWEERVLLKLRRTYSKDEAVAAYVDELKNLNFRMGQMKSYVAELEDKVAVLEKAAKKRESKIADLRKLVKAYDNGVMLTSLKNKNEQLVKDLRETNLKIVDLLSRKNNLNN